jgi:hypothetical protein
MTLPQPRKAWSRAGRIGSRLEPAALSVAADWMDRQHALWERLFAFVDEYLNQKEPK